MRSSPGSLTGISWDPGLHVTLPAGASGPPGLREALHRGPRRGGRGSPGAAGTGGTCPRTAVSRRGSHPTRRARPAPRHFRHRHRAPSSAPNPPAPGGRTPQCPGRGPASGFACGAARTGPRSPRGRASCHGGRAAASPHAGSWPLPRLASVARRLRPWHTPRTEPLGRGFTSGDPSGRPQWGRRPRPGRAPGVVLVCPRRRPATLAGVPSGDRALQGCRGRGAARHLRPEPGHTAGHTGHVPAAGATGGSRFWLPLRGLGSAVTSSFVCDTGPSQAQRPCACSGRRLPRGPGVTRLPLSPGWGLKQGGPGGAGEPEATPHVQSSNSRNVGETRTPPGRPGQPTSLGSRGWGRTVPVHAALTPRGMLGPQGLLPLPVPLLGDLWGRER